MGRRRVAALCLVATLASCGLRADGDRDAQQAGGGPTTAAAPFGAPTAPAHRLATPLPTAGSQATEAPTSAAAPDVRAAPPSVDDATTPRQLAAALVAAETAVRDPRVTGAALADAAHAQQRAYRRLALRPRWRRKVIELVPRELRPAVRRNALAAASLAALVAPQSELPDWQILPPAPPEELLAHYRTAAARFGLEWQYLAAINLVETRMGRIRGRSSAGAQGPMQFMPSTWDAYGRGDVNDDGDAIMAAARYLAAHGAPGDMRRALWHYNHSDRYVDAVSAYAEVMRDDARTFRGYYHWQVHYVTTDGDVHLPEGYGT